MSFPTTITLNVGSPAADRVYTYAGSPDANGAIYYAPSPQNDLAGRPSLRLSHQTTKSGIIRTLAQFVFPQYNSTTGEYDDSVTHNSTTIRPVTMDLDVVDEAMESGHELMDVTDVRALLGAGELPS